MSLDVLEPSLDSDKNVDEILAFSEDVLKEVVSKIVASSDKVDKWGAKKKTNDKNFINLLKNHEMF